MSRLIAFEGPDGSGKSTLLKLVSEEMSRLNIDHIKVRNPGGTPSGEAIRDLLLDPTTEMTQMTEVYLFIASRVQLIEELVKPALLKGQIVLCDRLDLSTLFYQTAGYKWSMIRKYGNSSEINKIVLAFYTQVKDLSNNVTNGIDLRYVIADASNEVLNKRRPPNMKDRFEMKEESFQKDVRSFYRHFTESPTWNTTIRPINTDHSTTALEITNLIDWMTQSTQVCPTTITA